MDVSNILPRAMLVLTSVFYQSDVISSLQKSSENYYWHITDMHYDHTYWTTQDSCHRVIPPERLGRYGDYECDAPWQLVQSAVDNMKVLGPTPKFVIWTGDNLLHPKLQSSKSVDLILDVLRNLTRLINETFSGIPVYVTLGNHDYFPTNQFPGHPSHIYNITATEIWSNWLETEENRRTFANGAYYTKLMPEVGSNVRAVIVDTNLYYNRNKAVVGESDPAGQFQWLTQILESARRTGEKLHVITHIPPGVMEEKDAQRWLMPEYNDKLVQLLQSYSDVILVVYSAHQHFDSFRMIYSTDGRPVSSILLAPSVTPWKARIPNNTTGRAHNPGIRKLFYDSQTFQMVDYEQYYIDLPTANNAGTTAVSWSLLYSFRSTYGVPDMIAASMNKVLEDLKSDVSQSFANYLKWNTLGMPSDELGCDCQCKYHHLCSIQFVRYNEFDDCIRQVACSKSDRAKTSIALLIVTTILYSYQRKS